VSCHDAEASYHSASASENGCLRQISRYGTVAHRNGLPSNSGSTDATELKARQGRRKRTYELANAQCDRDTKPAAIRAYDADRNDLMGAVMAEGSHSTKTALMAKQALLQGLRRHASLMAAASEPGMCTSDNLFHEPGGQLLPT
jgi:hypothetical protein